MAHPIVDHELSSTGGARVGIRPTPAGEILETRDSRGQLVFEFNAASGRAVLHFGGSGLRLQAVDGRVEIVSESTIAIRSEGGIELEGARGVRLACGPHAATVTPEGIDVDAAAARVRVDDARVSCGKLEQKVDRVLLWAKDVYHRIEGLLHTRAGRVRTEAERDHLVQAERARLQAEGDVHVQGRTVNLG
ncbi:MAG TPA: DUF3540 domain-containing protein [Planctomycetota bacterium]|nr:DUF3540 domain-containing protein [Planctomycetota bacterium]